MSYTAQVEAAAAAAEAAGDFIAGQIGRLEEDDIREKGVHDLVTSVDEEAQRIIIGHLSRRFPHYDVLAEEGDASLGRKDAVEGFRWIIDPLDGTTNFTRALPPFAVSIGLEKEGEIVAGVVLEVTRRELFTASKGGGLFLNGKRRRVSSERTMKRSLITTGFPFRYFDYVDGYLKTLHDFMYESQGVRRPGSAAVDLAYVACGRFDGFFETGLSVWDVAAGTLLVTEGGGRVTDFDGGDDYLFPGNLIASNGLIHEEMLRIAAPMRQAIHHEEDSASA